MRKSGTKVCSANRPFEPTHGQVDERGGELLNQKSAQPGCVLEVVTDNVERGQCVHPIDVTVHPQLMDALEVSDTWLPADAVNHGYDVLSGAADRCHLLNLSYNVGELAAGRVETLGRDDDAREIPLSPRAKY